MSLRTLLIVLVPAGLTLVLVAMVSVAYEVETSFIVRDPAALAGLPPLAGALSSLGAFLWCSAAAISLFAAFILRGREEAPAIVRFFAWSGALSLYLLLDDYFQVHEDLIPRLTGADELVPLALLGTAVAGWLLAYRRVILASGYPLLALAFVLLAASVLVDVLIGDYLWRLRHWSYFVEDGLKWLGIACWCGYHVSTAWAWCAAPRENRTPVAWAGSPPVVVAPPSPLRAEPRAAARRGEPSSPPERFARPQASAAAAPHRSPRP